MKVEADGRISLLISDIRDRLAMDDELASEFVKYVGALRSADYTMNGTFPTSYSLDLVLEEFD